MRVKTTVTLGSTLALALIFTACTSPDVLSKAGRAVSSALHTTQRASKYSYQVIYNFNGGDDGSEPGGLISVQRALYGTTDTGGKYNLGTFFRVTKSGKHKVLYSFSGGSDGSYPGLPLYLNGTFYGTTAEGGGGTGCGANGCGTVYALSRAGVERVLHVFTGGSEDGAYPYAPLLDVKGVLYGVTTSGGSQECGGLGCGTVFSITTAGEETVLHDFGESAQGWYPLAGLVNVKGTLYGTTFRGGTGCDPNGCGTIYSITTTGEQKVLYYFQGGSDGVNPDSKLIDVAGTLYGTTALGGGDGCYGEGCGTFFKVTTNGTEEVLHDFGDAAGTHPTETLINVQGLLYGTTDAGGLYNEGTVYSITTSGTAAALHSFGYGYDGKIGAALVNTRGSLFGTTLEGGHSECYSGSGCGIVFALSP